jgi:hypothetical protein
MWQPATGSKPEPGTHALYHPIMMQSLQQPRHSPQRSQSCMPKDAMHSIHLHQDRPLCANLHITSCSAHSHASASGMHLLDHATMLLAGSCQPSLGQHHATMASLSSTANGITNPVTHVHSVLRAEVTHYP